MKHIEGLYARIIAEFRLTGNSKLDRIHTPGWALLGEVGVYVLSPKWEALHGGLVFAFAAIVVIGYGLATLGTIKPSELFLSAQGLLRPSSRKLPVQELLRQRNAPSS
jgi:hypothetical protein